MKKQKVKDVTRERFNSKKNSSRSSKPASKDTRKPKSNFGLDSTDMKALKELQKAQPSVGWTAKKYASYKSTY